MNLTSTMQKNTSEKKSSLLSQRTNEINVSQSVLVQTRFPFLSLLSVPAFSAQLHVLTHINADSLRTRGEDSRAMDKPSHKGRVPGFPGSYCVYGRRNP